MNDLQTHKGIRVSADEPTGPYITVLVDQLDQVRRILDANRIRYWVDHLAISIDDQPAETVINVDIRHDARHVQAILDSAA